MKVLILGGGYAGVTAALRLAHRARGRAQVTLVNATDRFVERIRLHERAAGRTPKVRSIASFLRGSGAQLAVGHVSAVDVEARTVRLDDDRVLSWDRLVVALGSRTAMSTPGAREHAISLDPAGAESLAARLPSLAARRARIVVVGGGLTGIEAATEIAEAWPELRVTLLTQSIVGAGLSEAARRHFARALERLGVDVVANAPAVHVLRDEVVTGDGVVPFDACVWAVGFEGAPLPPGLALERNARGRVLVDPFLRALGSTVIYVAGDLAMLAAPPAIPVPMGCKSAGPSGAHVADNLLRELASRSLREFDFAAPLYCASLGRRDGVVQCTRADGALQGPVISGRPAAWIKELICKMTMFAFTLEQYGLASYGVFRAGNLPVLAAKDASLGSALRS